MRSSLQTFSDALVSMANRLLSGRLYTRTLTSPAAAHSACFARKECLSEITPRLRAVASRYELLTWVFSKVGGRQTWLPREAVKAKLIGAGRSPGGSNRLA